MNPQKTPKPASRNLPLRIARGFLLCCAALATLLAIAWGFESWRGKRAWTAYRKAAEARGEKLYLKEFVPAPVPPEDNFAMTPFLAPLLEYSYVNRTVEWKDPRGRERAEKTTLARRGATMPRMGSLESGKLTELSEWREYLRTNDTDKSQSDSAVVLEELKQFEPVLMELRDATHRRYAVFPIHYDEVAQALLPYLGTLRSVTQIARLRAAALLMADRPAEALEEVRLIVKIADAIKLDPLMISKLVRVAILRQVADAVWEGTERHVWKEEQLRELQSLLGGIDLIPEYPVMARGERAFANDFVRNLMLPPRLDTGDDDLSGKRFRLAPSGWLYQNQVRINELYDQRVLPLVDVERRQLRVSVEKDADEVPSLKKATPYNALARMLFPAVNKAAAKLGYGQTITDLALLNCALERARLADGAYPPSLESLVPKYVSKIPHDLIDGAPLRYRTGGKTSFVIYSIGANRQDEQGLAVFRGKSETELNLEAGDWVWKIGGKG